MHLLVISQRWHEVPLTEFPGVSVVLPPKPSSDEACPYLTYSVVFASRLALSSFLASIRHWARSPLRRRTSARPDIDETIYFEGVTHQPAGQVPSTAVL